jgi:hypothetical protein
MLKYYRKLPNPLGYLAKRIDNHAKRVATDYISSIMENLAKEPQLVAAILQKPVRLLVDDLLKNPPKGIGKIIGDTAIESSGNTLVDVGQFILPMFGPNGKKLAAGLRFLPLLQNKGKSNDSGKNPFDR